jgi:hypothetical protein
MRRLLAFALLSSPATALACAACARDTRPWAQALLAAMILLPFAIAAVVYRVLARGERELPW